MRTTLLLLVLGVACVQVCGSKPPLLENVNTGIHEVVDYRVVDGDTIQGTLLLPWDIAIYPAKIRAGTYDAWEISRRRRSLQITDEEIRKGKATKKALEGFLATGRVFLGTGASSRGKRDNYGRIVGVLFLAADNRVLRVGEWMRNNGHVRNEL